MLQIQWFFPLTPAGQTLGSGTNPSPLSVLSALMLSLIEVEPNEVGEGMSGRALEYLNIVEGLKELF